MTSQPSELQRRPRSGVGRFVGIVDSARLTGGWRHVELALFEVIGAAAPVADPPATAAFLAGAALAHAWRAEQLEALLPVSLGLPDAAACTTSPSAAFDETRALISDAARTAVAEGATLAGAALVEALVETVYPTLSAAYRWRRLSCDHAADPPLRRTLGRLLSDLDSVTSEGATLLGGWRSAAADLGTLGALALRVREALDVDAAPFGVSQPA